MAQNLVSKNNIAELFDVSPRRIEQLTSEGVIKSIGRPAQYDLLPTIKAYIKYLADKAYGRQQKESVADLEEAKLRAETEMKESKAKITKLQLKEFEGKMHRSEDVEAVMNDLVYTIRGMITALPGRLAIDVIRATNANEASAIIRSECYKILNELATYKYDPEVYHKRVMEREGWEVPADDENDEA